MAEKIPLDARLLSNAVIELNIARHILPLYSREHQLVQLSLDKTFAILADLFELRPEIALAVAKDTLIVDGHQLDPKNPVYREFALSLSRMSVATISFVKGLTREEVFDFFRFLSRDAAGISSETLPQILAEYGLRHILIEPVDYRVFAFAEDRAKQADSEEYLLERYIKALLEGELPRGGVQAVVENVEPGTLALLMNQAGGEIAGKASYDMVVSSYLRGGTGQSASGGDLQRLMTFIAGLRPELKQQFLASSVAALSRDTASLNQALEGVSVDSIIEFVTELDQNRVALPAELGTLIARFARTGAELPGGGLSVDDVLLSPEIASLFKADESHQHGPESYQAEIGRVVEVQIGVAPDPAGSDLAHELSEDYVRYCYANALLALVDSPLPGLTTLEDEDTFAANFTALAKHSVETGQYAQLLELLNRFEDLERRGSHLATVRAVREYCGRDEFIEGIVDSFRRHGRANRAGAALVCAFYGSAIVPPLFDLLALEERTHVRRMLLQLLVGLGEHAVREVPLRLLDKRWHVRRNTLYLLAECGARLDPGLLERLSGDSDPRVRLECARCLVLAGDAGGVPILRALLRDPADGVADAAVAAAGALGVEELLPDLLALVKKPTGNNGVRQRLRVVRALGLMGGDQAENALRELLAHAGLPLPRGNQTFSQRGPQDAQAHRRQAAAGRDAAGRWPAAGGGAMNDATFRGLIWNLVVGISQGRFYSIDHESVRVAAERVRALLGEFPDGSCTIMVIKDDLVFNNMLFRESGMHGDEARSPARRERDLAGGVPAGRHRRGDPQVLRRRGGRQNPPGTLRAHPPRTRRVERRGARRRRRPGRCRLSRGAAGAGAGGLRAGLPLPRASRRRTRGGRDHVPPHVPPRCEPVADAQPGQDVQRAHLHARHQRLDPGHGAGREPRPQGRVGAGDRHRGAAARRRQAAHPQGDPAQAGQALRRGVRDDHEAPPLRRRLSCPGGGADRRSPCWPPSSITASTTPRGTRCCGTAAAASTPQARSSRSPISTTPCAATAPIAAA